MSFLGSCPRLAAVLGIAACFAFAQAASADSLTADFGGGNQIAATIGDFQSLSPAVAGNPFIFTKGDFGDLDGFTIVGMDSGDGITADMDIAYNGYGSGFTTGGGAYAGDPILGDYIFSSAGFNGSYILTSITGIAPGDLIKLVVYGVGDVDNQDARVTVTNNATVLGPNFHEADGRPQAFSVYDFNYSGGEIVIEFAHTGSNTAFGGFSLATAVPEPASFAIFAIGCLGLVTCRRRLVEATRGHPASRQILTQSTARVCSAGEQGE